MLESEFKYYLDHQDQLVKAYNSKFWVIKDEDIQGIYESKEQAYDEAIKKFELGTFLIQQCLPGERSHTQTFHSQVRFNPTILR